LEEPIRAELFGVERLKPHADSLAAAQVVFSKPRLYPLLTPRVLENGRVLLECTESLPGRFSRSM
jgi:cyclic beta-1,2-glucan synthetase